MAVWELGRAEVRAASTASEFRVEFVRDWNLACALWDGSGYGTAFQHKQWLDAWYSAFDRASPLIALISDAATQRNVALVPLICREQHGVRLVEFADLGLTDYNAPILGAGAPRDPEAMHAMARALHAALRRLPERVDLIRMQKMPAKIDGRPNPLVALGRIGSCSLNGNIIEVDDDFETYRASIKRMQLPRSWRVFNRYPGAGFRMINDTEEALRLIDVMDAQQEARMESIGESFILNDGSWGKFYRDLVKRGLKEGYAVVSSLSCDEGVVATVLGIRRESNFVFLRISNAGKKWSHCSPSRLITERTMAALHADGVREFDLSIGNFVYKRRFGATPLPLTDVSAAIGWRGIPLVLRDRAAQELRRYPRLAEWISRALGRPAPREDN
ncbi:MAG: GNAT family N-acetyltransferase [Bradyrhizobium sp.]|uniref:GNAT family N-acetyltransferase n=1 Tax=Bradyrhizobium sp. TaxID=376 RepID=UPI0025BD7FB3|nr:GNAT family N-acetyltransferase [Bradyrhizobium sp.]MBI5264073.1 GNAT family N-acetyltransferase [Bradyrhizobium sp.]